MICLLRAKLHALFQNKFNSPTLKHAVVECDLRLAELCSLGLNWDIDGSELVFDWSSQDPAERLVSVAAFFGVLPFIHPI